MKLYPTCNAELKKRIIRADETEDWCPMCEHFVFEGAIEVSQEGE